MAKETTQKIFGPFSMYRAIDPTLVVEPNGGSVTLEIEVEPNNWEPVEVITTSIAKTIHVNGLRIRLTPAGGGAYALYGIN
jgi:hypothetical protein